MTTLMTYAGPAEPNALITRTGGLPLAPGGTAWPVCAECEGPMQFLAQILLDGQARPLRGGDDDGAGAAGRAELVMAVFMCQTDPGMCDAWSSTGGANAAFLFPVAGLTAMAQPEVDDPETVNLGACNAVRPAESPVEDYGTACEEWARTTGAEPRHVLGQLGGRPDWLQNDETPSCPACGRAMDLAAQLEEGPHHATNMNFGGCGSAYAFVCGTCREGAFLWQC
jgi:hypothetical protein